MSRYFNSYLYTILWNIVFLYTFLRIENKLMFLLIKYKNNNKIFKAHCPMNFQLTKSSYTNKKKTILNSFSASDL